MFWSLALTIDFMRVVRQVSHALLEEIRQINCRLIDTVVDICDEDVDPTIASVTAAEGAEGTIVKCSFIPVALSPSLKCHYASLQVSLCSQPIFKISQLKQLLNLLFYFYYFICFVSLICVLSPYSHLFSPCVCWSLKIILIVLPYS